MKEDKEIDKLFKEKLGNLGSQGIPQSYLDDINDRLDNLEIPADEKKRKRRRIWIWFIPFTCVISAVFYFNTHSSYSDLNRTEDANNGLAVNNSDQIEETQKRSFTQKSNSNISNDSTREETQVPVDIISKENTSVSASTNSSSGTLNAFENTSSKTPIHIKVKSVDNKIKNKKSFDKKKPSLITSQNNTTGKDEESNVKKVEGYNNKELLQNNRPDSTTNTRTSDPQKELVDSEMSAKTDTATITLDSINNELIKKDSKADSVNTVSVDSIKKDTSDYVGSASLQLSSIQLSGGAVNVFSLFDFKDINMTNKNPDKSKPVTAIDIALQAVFKKDNLYYSAGFYVNQWTEQFKYDVPVSSTTTETKVIGYQQITSYPVSHQNVGHTDAFGNFVLDSVITIVDTIVKLTPITSDQIVQHKDTVTKEGMDKYNYVSIPISIGFQLGSNKFIVLPKIGGSIGIPVRSTSVYTYNLIEAKQNISAPIFVNLELSVDFTFNCKSFGFSIIPLYRRSIYYFNESADLTNKYNGAGVRAGVSYYFN